MANLGKILKQIDIAPMATKIEYELLKILLALS